jgi:predicted aspartyl protease
LREIAVPKRRETSWHKHEFDLSYTPPAPALSIQIAGPEASDWIQIDQALIDTGADATMIPQRLLEQILAAEWDQAWLSSQWGERRLVYRYEIDLRIGERVFAGVLVVADDQGDEVVLGRGLLNRLRFLVDGPQQTVELLE